jgi:hypothetical protein
MPDSVPDTPLVTSLNWMIDFPMSTQALPPADTARNSGSVSGRKVVAAMLALGVGITGLLFLYWNLHLMPFMPLQKAIVQEFKNSSPRVEGGRRKMHQQTPMMLRVVMRVAFDPTAEDDKTIAELSRHMDRIRELASQQVPISEYELLEVNFYFPVREKEIHEKQIRKSLSTWQDVTESGTPLDKPTAASK